MFETASFHIVKPCNMRCKFCYATFEDIDIVHQMPLIEACDVVKKLADGGLQKITFAGGEPMLYRYLEGIIQYSKSIGLTTSIITNGSLITNHFLKRNVDFLDWIGISVDSLNPEVNAKIGRVSKNPPDYYSLINQISSYGYKVKINTVVNSYNQHETLKDFIEYSKAKRWKVFQALRVEGQNDRQFHEIRVDAMVFDEYVNRNWCDVIVPENNLYMTGSYLLIDPFGRLFENSSGKHTYSEPLQKYSLEYCLNQISLNRDRFIKRGGIYEW